jgi:mycothiol synthase
VVLLGEVRELEVDGERPQDARLALEREPADRLAQLVPRLTRSRRPREAADQLLGLEQLLALLLDDDAAEDLAEQPDVAAERCFRIRGGSPYPAMLDATMELLPGFRMRPPADEDAEEVAAVSNEECIAYLGVPVVNPDWLRRRWTAPGGDREQDFAVVESPNGGLCAYLGVEAEPPFAEVFALGIVGPAYHGRGLGAAIVSETERRARRFEALADPSVRVVIHAGALADEPRVSALMRSRGYREVRRFELRRVDFEGEPPEPREVDGITVRGFRPEDERPLYEAHVAAFADHWGSGEETYEGFHHHNFEAPEFDAALWFLAWDGDRLAGYLGAHDKAREDASRGYVALLGVRREYRRRGLGEALLLHAFRALHARGRRGVDLHVDTDSLTGATRLYERVGMAALPRFATWEKELRPAR